MAAWRTDDRYGNKGMMERISQRRQCGASNLAGTTESRPIKEVMPETTSNDWNSKRAKYKRSEIGLRELLVRRRIHSRWRSALRLETDVLDRHRGVTAAMRVHHPRCAPREVAGSRR